MPVWMAVPIWVTRPLITATSAVESPPSACCMAGSTPWNSDGMPETKSDSIVMPPVIAGVRADTACEPTPTTDAWRLPSAPSMVLVEVAACTATSCIPSFCTAAKNSSAEISPFSIASRKFPSKAPASRIACWSAPDAPGMASVSWFQFSVMSLPAPAVCVMTCPTLWNVPALPPATAFRLPAASASCA